MSLMPLYDGTPWIDPFYPNTKPQSGGFTTWMNAPYSPDRRELFALEAMKALSKLMFNDTGELAAAAVAVADNMLELLDKPKS